MRSFTLAAAATGAGGFCDGEGCEGEVCDGTGSGSSRWGVTGVPSLGEWVWGCEGVKVWGDMECDSMWFVWKESGKENVTGYTILGRIYKLHFYNSSYNHNFPNKRFLLPACKILPSVYVPMCVQGRTLYEPQIVFVKRFLSRICEKLYCENYSITDRQPCWVSPRDNAAFNKVFDTIMSKMASFKLAARPQLRMFDKRSMFRAWLLIYI